MVINFDNAATSFPKPPEVRAAALYGIDVCGGNPGRGGHPLSMLAAEAVFSAREAIAELFGGAPEQVVLTSNCTHALNLAIQGVMRQGGHIIISDLEHNSVARPVAALAQAGLIKYSVAHVSPNDAETVAAFRRLITPQTKAVAITLASNVTGQVLPWREIFALCKRFGICCIADGAQACGILPVQLTDGINILCAPGHKGLHGVSGTGFLLTDGKFNIPPMMQGGTGSTSLDLTQPEFLPDSLESGTVNTLGALTMKAGIGFVKRIGLSRIHAYETGLCQQLLEGLSRMPQVTVYRHPAASYAPIVSFNVAGHTPEDVAQQLGKKGFCLRAGYHCAALSHTALNTPDGTVRFAPGPFNREKEVMALLAAIQELAAP